MMHRFRPARAAPALAAAMVCLLAACGSAPRPRPVDPHLEEALRQEQMLAREARSMEENLEQQIFHFDHVLQRYIACLQSAGNVRADEQAVRFRRYLVDNSERWLDLLLRELETSEFAFHRFVAAGVLGFADSARVITPLVNALADEDQAVRANAAFSLGEMRDLRTPIEPLVEVVMDQDGTEASRANAARALYRLQEGGVPGKEMEPYWLRFLEGNPARVEAGVAVHALRGLGLLREARQLDAILPYLSHQAPLVRAAAAVAAGRTRSRAAAPDLIALLGPAEANRNVRLCARKALQEISGVDRREDVKEWRRVFGLSHP